MERHSDFLSRNAAETHTISEESSLPEINLILKYAPLSFKEIQEATKTVFTLEKVQKCVKSGRKKDNDY